MPFNILTPKMKSRTAPAPVTANGRRGPESPAATAPPMVVAAEKRGGSNPSIWFFNASNSSKSATRVPARALTTSSPGS